MAILLQTNSGTVVGFVCELLGIAEGSLVPAASRRLPSAAATAGLPAAVSTTTAAAALGTEELLQRDDARDEQGNLRRDQGFTRQKEQTTDGNGDHGCHFTSHGHHHAAHHSHLVLLATT